MRVTQACQKCGRCERGGRWGERRVEWARVEGSLPRYIPQGVVVSFCAHRRCTSTPQLRHVQAGVKTPHIVV